MKEKYEVESLFKILYSMIENLFQTKIGILHTDNGTEYFKEVLGIFFKEKGIHHQTTCVDTPQQNGIVERKNKHLLEIFRAIMFYTNVPRYLWGAAVLITSYLINKMPTRVLNYFTPLECFQKYFPESQIQSNRPLKIFGCTVYVHIPSKDRSKIDPRAEKYILLVMHLIKKDTSILIQKQGKLLFQWMLLFGKNNPFLKKKFSKGGEYRRRRKFLGCYFESPT